MARTVDEIKAEMTSAFMTDEAARSAYGLGEGDTFAARFGPATVESILFGVFALCAHAVERLVESHLREVSALVAARRPHTLEWYRRKALAFRLGEAVDDATADYASAATAETVMPVGQAAVVEAEGGGLVVKAAALAEGGALAPLPADRLAALGSYLSRVKDAGVRLTVVSRAGDRLRLSMVVYVDGTLYAQDGTLLAEPRRPVEEAVRDYLTRLPFNGELVLEHLTDHLQGVEGVEVPHVASAASAQVSEAGQTESGYGPMEDIDVRRTPASGYFVVSFDEADEWRSLVEYRFKP